MREEKTSNNDLVFLKERYKYQAYYILSERNSIHYLQQEIVKLRFLKNKKTEIYLFILSKHPGIDRSRDVYK